MPIFATEYTEINCLPGFTVDTDFFSVDLVVALDGDVECLFLDHSHYFSCIIKIVYALQSDGTTFRFQLKVMR